MKDVEKNDSQASENQDVKKEDQTASPDASAIDYKAELEAEVARHAKTAEERENYKQGLLSAKEKNRNKKKGEEHEEEEGDEDARINAIVDEKLSDIKKTLDVNSFDSLIHNFTTDPDEAALIRYHFENTVAPVGSLRERIENAQLLANKKQFLKENSEMKRALESKNGVSRIAAGSGSNLDVEKSAGKEIFTAEQIAAWKKRGLDVDKIKENYLKNIQR